MTREESAWRKAIADQVRRNCTPDSEAYDRGGDIMIAAVADWIENPPDWSTFEHPLYSADDIAYVLTLDALDTEVATYTGNHGLRLSIPRSEWDLAGQPMKLDFVPRAAARLAQTYSTDPMGVSR